MIGGPTRHQAKSTAARWYLQSRSRLDRRVARPRPGFDLTEACAHVRSHGGMPVSRYEMVRHQLARRGIVDARVLAAMETVPREIFLPADARDEAYSDRAVAIDCGQTISQPYIVALMTEAARTCRVAKKSLRSRHGQRLSNGDLIPAGPTTGSSVVSIERRTRPWPKAAAERSAGAGR